MEEAVTLEEKVGLMFHTAVSVNRKGALSSRLSLGGDIEKLITERHLTHFNLMFLPEPAVAASWHNEVQRLAAATRLGIPVTLSSDPRHAAGMNPGARAMLQEPASCENPQADIATLEESRASGGSSNAPSIRIPVASIRTRSTTTGPAPVRRVSSCHSRAIFPPFLNLFKNNMQKS